MSAFTDEPDRSQTYVAAISSGMATGTQSFVPMWFVGTRKGDVRTTFGKRMRVPIGSLFFGTNWSTYRFERGRGGDWQPICISSHKTPQESEKDGCCLVNSLPFQCRQSPWTIHHHQTHPSQRGWF
ncbi:hypothetical protein GMAR_ORF236 [Golden Marseillevirus]|uniref:hypothetical protein n=1 Tax=Golden Marseillevirus TaxID=1720526 RepID=UPI000877AC72|nr:hypothetical protein GMAR_ORF236 [Golden Marseillevirus]ALX27610.1 hypothetical protein GMAR_ORF236 [Golden Marseillevirus]